LHERYWYGLFPEQATDYSPIKDQAILAVNGGSSSVKAALFQGDLRQDFHYASISRGEFPDHASAYKKLTADLHGQTIHAVGHRITHGGDVAEAARMIDDQERARLQNLAPLAPLHQPHNLLGVALFAQYLSVKQVACFDTAFHATLPELAQRLPVPSELGFKRRPTARSRPRTCRALTSCWPSDAVRG